MPALHLYPWRVLNASFAQMACLPFCCEAAIERVNPGGRAALAPLALPSFHTLPPSRNPKVNSTINPKINSTINPKINSTINPKINSTINPRINSTINPRINSAINPKINSTVNPKINSTINPRINSTINPRINSTINPKINSAINPRISASLEGFYYFNLDGELSGLLVKANEDVLVMFDGDLDWIAHAVSNSAGGYNLFDLDGEWTGLQPLYEQMHKSGLRPI
jgi:hypothetical protein